MHETDTSLPSVEIVVAMTPDGTVGVRRQVAAFVEVLELPWQSFKMSGDMTRFRFLTDDRVIVMGSRTWSTLRGALKNRTSFVLTSKARSKNPVDTSGSAVMFAQSMDDVVEKLKSNPIATSREARALRSEGIIHIGGPAAISKLVHHPQWGRQVKKWSITLVDSRWMQKDVERIKIDSSVLSKIGVYLPVLKYFDLHRCDGDDLSTAVLSSDTYERALISLSTKSATRFRVFQVDEMSSGFLILAAVVVSVVASAVVLDAIMYWGFDYEINLRMYLLCLISLEFFILASYLYRRFIAWRVELLDICKAREVFFQWCNRT